MLVLLYGSEYCTNSSQMKTRLQKTDILLQKDAEIIMPSPYEKRGGFTENWNERN